MEGTPHSFEAEDGHSLAGTVFEAERPVGFVVVNSGTAIPRRYYRRYAAWLASQGYSALTYDYRGIGGSLRGPLAESSATMTQWGRLDLSAAFAEARRLAPGLPRMAVGHSAGAQLLGMARGVEEISGVLAIAASTGTWWRMDPPVKWQCIAMWYLFVPVTTTVQGYFPARRLGWGADLPAGVAREWGKWCRHADYLSGYWSDEDCARYETLTIPWHSLAFADDPIANRATVSALQSLYPNVQCTDEFIAPETAGMKAIGHMGFFKEDASETLWPKSLEVLRGFHANSAMG